MRNIAQPIGIVAYGHMIALTNYKPALNQFFYTLFLSQSKPISL